MTQKMLVLAATLLPVAGGAVVLLPRDGDRVTVQQVEFVSPDAGGDGLSAVWDFSALDVVGDNIEWRYDYVAADSLVSETRPGVRRDYRVAGDSVWHVCSETSSLRIGIDPPAAASPAVQGGPVGERARYYQSQYFSGTGEAAAAVEGVGTAILPHGVTLPGVKLVHRRTRVARTMLEFTPQPLPAFNPADTTLTLHTEDVYTWHSPSLRYPLAETRIVTDSIAGAEYNRETASYLCLPENQPYEYALRQSLENRLSPDGGNGGDGPQGASPLPAADEIAVAQNGDTVEASFTATADGTAEMLLADILGHVYAYSPRRTLSAGESVTFSVSTATLPPGDYLLHIISGPDYPPVLKKILLH